MRFRPRPGALACLSLLLHLITACDSPDPDDPEYRAYVASLAYEDIDSTGSADATTVGDDDPTEHIDELAAPDARDDDDGISSDDVPMATPAGSQASKAPCRPTDIRPKLLRLGTNVDGDSGTQSPPRPCRP